MTSAHTPPAEYSRTDLRERLSTAVEGALFDTHPDDVEVSIANPGARTAGLVGNITLPARTPAGGGLVLNAPRAEASDEVDQPLTKALAEQGWEPGGLRGLQDGGAMLNVWEQDTASPMTTGGPTTEDIHAAADAIGVPRMYPGRVMDIDAVGRRQRPMDALATYREYLSDEPFRALLAEFVDAPTVGEVDDAADQAGVSRTEAEEILEDHGLWRDDDPDKRLVAYWMTLEDGQFADLLAALV
jgi:hypothetical protein